MSGKSASDGNTDKYTAIKHRFDGWHEYDATALNRCECGADVDSETARVFGDNRGVVQGCPECMGTETEAKAAAFALDDRDRHEAGRL